MKKSSKSFTLYSSSQLKLCLDETVKLDLNGWVINAKGLYVIGVLASLGFFTFTCERCAQIIRLIITCLNTPVENQRREK